MKGDSKFDIGSVIGITLGFIVIFIGFYDVTPVSKITPDMQFEMYQNKILLNPLGTIQYKTEDGPGKVLPGILGDYGNTINFFIDIKSIIIVLLGVLAATFVNLPLSAFGDIVNVTKVIFRNESYDYVGTIDRICERATKARKDGILSLEKDLEEMKNPFFRKGIEIAINEKEVTRLRFLLVQEKDAIEDRHIAGAELYSCMAGYSPAFGMLGTVMGLVIMMNSFGGGEVEAGAAPQSTAEKFSGLLSGMAMALVTTFYGVFFANVFFTPMAGKLKRKDEMEMLHKNVIIEGVVSIKQNEHPLIIKEKLMTMVPPDVVLTLQDENREVS